MFRKTKSTKDPQRDKGSAESCCLRGSEREGEREGKRRNDKWKGSEGTIWNGETPPSLRPGLQASSYLAVLLHKVDHADLGRIGPRRQQVF